MKTKTMSGRMATVLLLFALYFSMMPGCKCRQSGTAESGGASGGTASKDTTAGCDLVKIDGLWNCKNNGCAGRCMLQITSNDTTWRNIPGGNLNPDDVKENQKLRCACQTGK